MMRLRRPPASHKSRPHTPRYVVVSPVRHVPALALGLIAFLAGAGTTWLVMSKSKPGAVSGLEVPASNEPEQPSSREVSHLPPAPAAVMLGNSYYDRQQWTEAVKQYEAAITAGMDNADVRTDLGNCFRFLGQSQHALDQYNRAQALNPRHENSLFNKAGLYVELLDDPERALSTAREFLSRFPDSSATPVVRRLVAEFEAAPGAVGPRPRLLDWQARPQHTTFRRHQSDAGTLR